MNNIENESLTLNISSFKAINHPELCDFFSTGHSNVLKDFGVKQVTSANKSWHKNPDSYAIYVQMNQNSDFVAGARVDVSTGILPLPIEEAIGFFDKSIYNLVEHYSKNKTGEVCGLWSSKDCAGKGVAFFLIKSSIALAKILKLGSLFALCSPYTVSMFAKLGFEIETSIGNQGTFYYPKLDLIATAMILKDLNSLENVSEENKHLIFNLYESPTQYSWENGSKELIKIKYNLTIC